MAVRPLHVVAGILALMVAAATPAQPTVNSSGNQILWAWERPEDLRFAGPSVAVGVLAGTVILSGSHVFAQPRLQPAKVLGTQQVAGVVHIEIDRGQKLAWTADQRTRASAFVLALLGDPRFAEAQVDFEVKASQRQVLLDLIGDVRAALPPGMHLSMTALASWCDTETWLDTAPVDEIIPMLFRMGPSGEALKHRLADGGDFRLARCRTSVGIATDTPPEGLPPGRRLWLFNPQPWTDQELAAIRARLAI
jgi:hypothetical protein